jgi:hypothetical protein
MELSPSCEAASHLTTQEFPNILWFSTMFTRAFLSQINPVHTTPAYLSLISILTLCGPVTNILAFGF